MDSDNADAMLDEFLKDIPEPVIFAPDNFEELVMQKIRALPADNKKYAHSADSLLCIIWGAFSVLFGLGFLAVMNKDVIIGYMSASPQLSGYTGILVALSDYINNITVYFMETSSAVISSVSGYILSSRYMLLLIIAVLFMIQYVVYKKNKAEI